MKKLYFFLLLALCCFPVWGKDAYLPKDNTVTASPIRKTGAAGNRSGWQVGTDYLRTAWGSTHWGNGLELHVGYLFNHWYFGLFGSRSRLKETYEDLLLFPVIGVETKYCFDCGKWSPYVGAGGVYAEDHVNKAVYPNNIYLQYKALFARLSGGVKYYLYDWLALHAGVTGMVSSPGFLMDCRLGLSFQF